MAKVVYYLKTLDIGGTTKTATLFARNLDKEKFDVCVAYESSGRTDRLGELEEAGIRTQRVDGTIVDFVDNEKPDIFHVFRSGSPESPHPGDIRAAGARAFIETNVFGLLDSSPHITRTLFMSRWLMEASLSSFRVSGPRFDFVNNPVESPATEERLDLGLPKDTIVLGRCGRPDPGIYDHISVQAAKILSWTGANVHFLIVAAPDPMVKHLQEFGIPHTLIDPTTDPVLLSKFYNTVDIYCHARADGETFGVNIAEAMMHAKPVITHVATQKVPGMSVFQNQMELVDDGVTGFVVRNYCHRTYADCIRKLAEDAKLREVYGRLGREKAMREYHVEPVVRKLESVYDECLS